MSQKNVRHTNNISTNSGELHFDVMQKYSISHNHKYKHTAKMGSDKCEADKSYIFSKILAHSSAVLFTDKHTFTSHGDVVKKSMFVLSSE